MAYAATKAGAIAAARTLAVEVGRDNIRVNCVSPGTIDTPMLERDLAGMDRRAPRVDALPDFRAPGRGGRTRSAASAPPPRSPRRSRSSPRDRGGYITGTNLVVDAGFSAVKSF